MNGAELSYDASAKAGSRFSFTVKGNFSALGISTPTWNPEQPSSAPKVPGVSPIDIRLVAAGQRVTIPSGSTDTIEDALKDIAGTVGAGADPSKLPDFDANAGWLIGSIR